MGRLRGHCWAVLARGSSLPGRLMRTGVAQHAACRLLYLLPCLLFAACTSPSPRPDLDAAARRGFAETRFPTQLFTLFGLYHPGAGAVLHVYIEGDGHAWDAPHRPSSDPTPRNPVALRLALADPGCGPVLYLARPCQFVRGTERRNCAVRWWTSARLGTDVIAALDEAVTQAKNRAGAARVALFGFSGGGGAAALLAARRDDVAFLGTVAGLLDTKAWTARMHVSPLAASLNPLDVAVRLRALPQLHLCSRGDTTMPPEISAGFCAAAGRTDSRVVVEGMPHGGAWETLWPELLARQP